CFRMLALLASCAGKREAIDFPAALLRRAPVIEMLVGGLEVAEHVPVQAFLGRHVGAKENAVLVLLEELARAFEFVGGRVKHRGGMKIAEEQGLLFWMRPRRSLGRARRGQHAGRRHRRREAFHPLPSICNTHRRAPLNYECRLPSPPAEICPKPSLSPWPL